MVLGLIGLLTITAIPVVTGVAEGVSEQKKANAEASNETRQTKFHIDIFCGANSAKRGQVHGKIVVLRNDKVYLHDKDPQTELPVKDAEGNAPHPFTGFYFMYPDDMHPNTRGLVSTISVDPPMLNWIYIDTRTMELKYGNRTTSREHIVGSWDWTEDELGVTLEDWEGFAAVEEEPGVWALYYDRYQDNLKEEAKGKTVLPCSLERRILPEEIQGKDKDEPTKTDKEVNSNLKGGFKLTGEGKKKMGQKFEEAKPAS